MFIDSFSGFSLKLEILVVCYDILIDADLKPWLVEVNASPSLSTTTEADRILKTSLLRDIYNIVAAGIPSHVPDTSKSLLGYATANATTAVPPIHLGPTGGCALYGGFYVLYDEQADKDAAQDKDGDGDDEDFRGRRKQSMSKLSSKAEWR